MAEFPSVEFWEGVQQRCNSLEDFRKATDWSDVNVVLAVGDQRYWLKLYRGKILDVMPYEPLSNALGYDVVVSGDRDAWKELVNGDVKFW
jgi:hypothetical protein